MWKIALALFLLPFALALFKRFFDKFKLLQTVNKLELKIFEKFECFKKMGCNDQPIPKKFDNNPLLFFLYSREELERAIAEYSNLLNKIDNTITEYYFGRC